MGSRRKARVLAVQALYSYDMSESSLEQLLQFEWSGKELAEDTAAFGRLLVAGTLENLEEIDRWIERQLEHWDITRLSRVDLAILRVSVYSLVHQTGIPASVTIDEAIGIAKEFGAEESFRFINGVLDGVRKGMQRT